MVLAIFLTLAAGLLAMGVVEVLAGSIGGTPLVIACYVVIAVILAVILMKMSKKEKENTEGAAPKKAEKEHRDEGEEK